MTSPETPKEQEMCEKKTHYVGEKTTVEVAVPCPVQQAAAGDAGPPACRRAQTAARNALRLKAKMP